MLHFVLIFTFCLGGVFARFECSSYRNDKPKSDQLALGNNTAFIMNSCAPDSPQLPLTAKEISILFQGWWIKFSKHKLAAHPLQSWLDSLVAEGAHVDIKSWQAMADHLQDRAPLDSELLFGNRDSLSKRSGKFWWLHHDGKIGPGLDAVLTSDGKVLVVWIVPEG